MNIGEVGLWTFLLDLHPAGRVREVAKEVEQMGWPTLWRPESKGRDALISSADLLAATSTLNIATGIAQTYARDPITAAAAQKTLCEAYDDRFLLGLGVAHKHSVEGIRHLDYSTPYSDMVAYLQAMKDAPYTAPEPATRPMTVLAALGPRMTKLSGTAADGSHPYFTPVEHTAWAREILGEGPILAPEIMVVIEPDVSRARDIARRTMARYLEMPNYTNNLLRFGFTGQDLSDMSDRLVDAIVACGDIDTTVARVQEHRDNGADHVCVQVLTAEDDLEQTISQWRLLAEVFEL